MKIISKIILMLALTLLMVGSYIFVEFNPVMAETKVIDNGLYRIKNAYSGLYLDIQDGSNADGSFCIQAQRADNTSQIFRLSKENTLRYVISIEKNLKVLEIGEKTQEDSIPVQQNNYRKETNQEWTIRQLSDGTIVFLNYLSKDAISVTDGDLNDGGLVVGLPYNGTNNQKWTLEPIEKSAGALTGNKENVATNNDFPLSSIAIAISNASILELVVIAIIIFIFVFVLTGYILYGLRVKPRLYIKGRLYYKPISKSDEKFVNYMDFKRKHKKKITISFDQGVKKADFFLGSETYDYQIIVENITEMTLPRFLEGYRSFDNDKNPIKLRVSATEPGILTFGEFVYSKHFIVDGSKFESGDILFRYVENEK
jgi:hypothetical protein